MLPFFLIKSYVCTSGHIFLHISTDDAKVLLVSSPLPPQLYVLHFSRPVMPGANQSVTDYSLHRMGQGYIAPNLSTTFARTDYRPWLSEAVYPSLQIDRDKASVQYMIQPDGFFRTSWTDFERLSEKVRSGYHNDVL